MRTGIVIGMGETGKPLFEILKEAYPDMIGADWDTGMSPPKPVRFMHICIPYSENFVRIVKDYQSAYYPRITIIHSTVPIGTTARIPNAVHSPIRGRHDRMKDDLLKYRKWVGGYFSLVNLVVKHMEKAGMKCAIVSKQEHTEAIKLLCLAKYGTSLAFAQYERSVLEGIGGGFKDIGFLMNTWDADYNEHVGDNLERPVFYELTDKIRGHCVTQNTRILNEQHPNQMLDEVLKYAEDRPTAPDKAATTWEPSNIYPTAQIGESVRIGAFSEIGENVKIGHSVTIGAFAFIPEGVTIEDGAWIGPRVTFSNDMYPPSGREKWEKTLVCKGARIGAGVCILPGITIGAGALIGMGAVVTQDVPEGETWVGVTARRLENGNNNRSQTSTESYCYV